jgi:hypothetical protein
MESIITRVLKDQWQSIQEDIEKLAASKVRDRIADKKLNVLAQLNGVTSDSMKEMANISQAA